MQGLSPLFRPILLKLTSLIWIKRKRPIHKLKSEIYRSLFAHVKHPKQSTTSPYIQKPNHEQSKFHFDFINDNNYYLQMKDIIERVFIMANIQKFVANNQRIFKKTLSYYIMHITVAMIVAYFVTGNLWMAVTLSLLEPTVQAFAFFFHERIWEKKNRTTEENIPA